MDENIDETVNGIDDENYESKADYEHYDAVSGDDFRDGDANRIVRHNIFWAAGLGSVPIPLFDLVAITGIQLKMINELSNLYDVPFSKNIAKSIIASLLAGAGSVGFARNLVCSLLKIIPGIGSILASFSMPLTAAAFTFAVGKIFIMHFESGGTLLDLNPSKVKKSFSNLYEKGKDVATSCCREKDEPFTV